MKSSRIIIVLLVLYVDEIHLIGKCILTLPSMKTFLGNCCVMKDLGHVAYTLSIKIYRD